MIKILSITVGKCGVLVNKKFEFARGLNIMYGYNETGKSTLQFFIKAVFYGISRQKEQLASGHLINPRERFVNLGDISGNMILEFNSSRYRIEVRFGARPVDDYVVILDDRNSSIVDENFWGEKIFGLSREAFAKTLWIKQGGVNISGENSDITKKLSNLILSGDDQISKNEVLKRFDDAKKSIKKSSKMRVMGKVDELENRRAILIALKGKMQEHKKYSDELELNLSRQRRAEMLAAKQSMIEQCKRLEDLNQKINATESNPNCNFFRHKDDKELDDIDNDNRELVNLRLACENLSKQITKNEIYLDKAEQNKTRRMLFFILGLFLYTIVCGVGYFIFPKVWDSLISFREYGVFSCTFVGFGVLLCIWKIFSSIKLSAKIKDFKKKRDEFNSNFKETRLKIEKLKKHLNENVYKPLDVIDHEQYINLKIKALNLISNSSGLKEGFELLLAGRNFEDIRQEVLIALSESAQDHTDVPFTEENILYLGKKIRDIESDIKKISPILPNDLDIEEELCEIEDILIVYNKKYCALQMAQMVICEVFDSIKDRFGQTLNTKANDIISLITSGKYKDLKISSDYAVNVQLSSGLSCSAGYLSAGVFDQMYFALRFALSEILCGQDRVVFLDEPFCQYDDERINLALNYLRKISTEVQIILFTCQRRECDIAHDSHIVNMD